MKIFAVFDFLQYDASASPKGEAFDEELQSQLDAIEVDGYELNEIALSRVKVSESSPLLELSELASMQAIKTTAQLVDDGKGEEPSTINTEYTNAQMLAWNAKILVEQIEKRLEAEKRPKGKRR